MSLNAPTRRILVVDDNPKIHEDFDKILGNLRGAPGAYEKAEAELFGVPLAPPSTDMPFALDFSHQGEDALLLVAQSMRDEAPYALAFMDMRMPPGWDGIRTMLELWAVDPRIQFVLCTAHSDYAWEDMVAKLGSSDQFLILKKPFDTIEVRQMAFALTEKWLLLREKESHLQALERQLRSEMESRVRAEKALRHPQKLEALGRLAAGIGHEINNPLSFILGNLEIVQEDLAAVLREAPDPRLDQARKMLAEAANGADRIARIVQKIRGFVDPTEGPLTRVDVAESVLAATKMIETELHCRAHLTTDLAAGAGVVADPHRLHQVLVNLLMNATHAFAADERMTTNEIHVSSRVEDVDHIVLEIRDNGVGIAESDLEKVFDPFFTTKRLDEGTGLGLSICRGIMESFGGTIGIRSAEGRGTVVRLTLRAAAPCEKAPAPVAPPADETALVAAPLRARILLVDDEPAILRLLARTLAAHDITAASNGREAAVLYQSRPFDLVLCDLMMPGVDGVDLFGQLAKLGKEHADRVVFLTGGAFTPKMTEFLLHSRNPVVDKPIEPRKLRTIVQTLLAAGSKADGQALRFGARK